MIDPEVFKTSRELARSKLPVEEARNSFGYYIDIPNDWESYKCPEELIRFLGIHSTHIYMFNEIIEDLGPLADDERDWTKRYVIFCEKVTRLLCTNGASVDLRYDIAETLSDWRTILKYIELPCHILEFGAGCGRQGISAFLRNPNNIYTAIDSTLAAYTLQNLMFSHADTLGSELTFFDFLDFETAGLAFPQISTAKRGSFFHVPAWLAEDNIPEKFFDLIIAAHVHNELSKYDFLRLIKVIDKGLSPDGIAYVRSEQTLGDTRDFFDTVDLHGIEMLKALLGKDIVPIFCRYEGASLNTIFARKNSLHYRNALASKTPESSFVNVEKAADLSRCAAEHYIERNLQDTISPSKKVALIGDGMPFREPFSGSASSPDKKIDSTDKSIPFYERFFGEALNKIQNKQIYREEQFLKDGYEDTQESLVAYDPDIIIIASHQHVRIEEQVRTMLSNREFPLRRHYWYPLTFLHRRSVRGTEGFFSSPILCSKDLEGFNK